MPLRLASVRSEDLPRLVNIYFSAFQDPLRLASFPDTPSTRRWWHDNLVNDLRSPGIHFMKCVDVDRGDDGGAGIVAFAQWRLEGRDAAKDGGDAKQGAQGSSEEEEAKTVWPEDGDGSVADAFFGRAKEMHNRIMDGEQHWYLELICTAPEHQRRGAASMLIRALFGMADESGRKVYLESSPSGVPTYSRLGFVERDSFGVSIKGEQYRNLCMVRDTASRAQKDCDSN